MTAITWPWWARRMRTKGTYTFGVSVHRWPDSATVRLHFGQTAWAFGRRTSSARGGA